MGLFRRGRRDAVYTSDWTVESVNRRSSAPDTLGRQDSASVGSSTEPTDGPLHKQSLSSSATSPSTDASTDNTGPATAADVLSMKVKLLERTLKQREETISHLRSAMELEDERVTRLELQIGRLVELSSPDRIREQRTQSRRESQASAGSGGVATRRRSSCNLTAEEEQHEAKLEITALNELLARVIAEKDRLGYENNNLKSLLRDQSRAQSKVCSKSFTSGARGNVMPSSIDALDKSLIEAEAKAASSKVYKPKGGRRKTDKTAEDDSSQEDGDKKAKVQQLQQQLQQREVSPKREVSPQPAKRETSEPAAARPATKSISFHDAPSPPVVSQAPAKSTSFHVTAQAPAQASSFHANGSIEEEEEQQSILYQMSCKNCHSGCQHLKFMSSFTAIDAKKELTKVLKMHYRQIWIILQHHEACDDASISSSVHEEELLNQHSNMTSNDWLSSSLARHIAKHCQHLENEVAVMKWCMKNVRVEIQKNMVETQADDFIANAANAEGGAQRRSRSKSIIRSRSKSKSRGDTSIQRKKHTSFHL